jgi:hypothetical protein
VAAALKEQEEKEAKIRLDLLDKQEKAALRLKKNRVYIHAYIYIYT